MLHAIMPEKPACFKRNFFWKLKFLKNAIIGKNGKNFISNSGLIVFALRGLISRRSGFRAGLLTAAPDALSDSGA
jgi:hypothetical protein